MSSRPYPLSADDVVYAIDAALPPKIVVPAPAEVVVDTLDARAGRFQRLENIEATALDYRERFPKANPATGQSRWAPNLATSFLWKFSE